MRIVFFGTPPFSAKVLAHLIENDNELVAVVTRPDKPKGRSKKMQPSAVKSLSLEKWPNLTVLQPEKASTEIFAEELKNLSPDLFIVVAYGEIIKTNLLEIPTKGCVNIHASLLPKYRGAAPIQRCLMNGEKQSGITIIEMVLKMDAGAMLEMIKTPIDEDMTFGELEEKLCNISLIAIDRVIEKIEKNQIQKIPQNEKEVTFASKITFEDRKINWKTSAENLHNQIRGLSPFPGAFTFVDVAGERKRLIIRKAKKRMDMEGNPGEILLYAKDEWVIACQKGALSLLEIQLEGKKTLSIEEFIRGMPSPPPENLSH